MSTEQNGNSKCHFWNFMYHDVTLLQLLTFIPIRKMFNQKWGSEYYILVIVKWSFLYHLTGIKIGIPKNMPAENYFSADGWFFRSD